MQQFFARIIYAFVWVVTLLPLRVLYIFSDIFFVITYFIAGYRKKVVRKNIAIVFPDKSNAERKKIEIRFYRYFCDQFIETLKLVHMSDREIQRRMRFKNPELLNGYATQGKSVVMCMSHYGNWEWVTCLPFYLRNLTLTTAYRPLQSKFADKIMRNIREKYGNRVSPMKIYFKALLEMRRNKENFIATLIADQSAPERDGRIWIDFFGRESNFFVGPGKMSVKLKSAVVFVWMNRIKRGYYECEFIELSPDASANSEEEIMVKYIVQVEKLIRAEPAYWLWSHNRWKRNREPEETVLNRADYEN